MRHAVTERNILEKLDSPFIVKLQYAFQTAEKLCFVLEYAAGGDLYFHLRKKGTFSEPCVIFYVAELTMVVIYDKCGMFCC